MSTKKRIGNSRREDRVPVSLNVKTSVGNLLTRDVSASAVFIESSANFQIGEEVKFAIELNSPGGNLILKCRGEVVRVENRDGRIGAAVKFVESVMESAEGSILTDSKDVFSSASNSNGLHH